MTDQRSSQSATERIIPCINMCFMNNSISCLERKTTFGTHDQTFYVFQMSSSFLKQDIVLLMNHMLMYDMVCLVTNWLLP